MEEGEEKMMMQTTTGKQHAALIKSSCNILHCVPILVCSETEFRCPMGIGCTNESNVCNAGFTECPDREDERGCGELITVSTLGQIVYRLYFCYSFEYPLLSFQAVFRLGRSGRVFCFVGCLLDFVI